MSLTPSPLIATSATGSTAVRRILVNCDPFRITMTLWGYRNLIVQFTRREIEGRYKGSYLGLFWSFLTPLVMLGVYTFVFGVVFKARWPHARGGESLAEFALVLFSGQLAFQIFSEPVSRGPGLITSVPNFVKKVVFPLQLLPIAVVGAALSHVGIGMLIALAASFFVFGSVPWTALLVPLSILPLAMLGLGVTWFLASLGVYLRDVGYLVGVALQVLFFATPIFYPVTAVPEPYRAWLSLNPLTPMVELVRTNLIIGGAGDPAVWATAFAIGLAAMILGHGWFMITRRGFADVL
jgi:lipopolysaccharide transport system permease protein